MDRLQRSINFTKDAQEEFFLSASSEFVANTNQVELVTDLFTAIVTYLESIHNESLTEGEDDG